MGDAVQYPHSLLQASATKDLATAELGAIQILMWHAPPLPLHPLVQSHTTRTHSMIDSAGCYAIAQQGGSSWAATLKTAHLRGAQIVIAAMANHQDSLGVQQWGCCALAQMTTGSEAARKTVLHEGGVLAVNTAMALYPQEAVQGWGTESLSVMRRNADGTRTIPRGTVGRHFGHYLTKLRKGAQ